jgi:creatinine amidohydrolase
MRIPLLILLILLPATAMAGPASFYLEDLTWPEVRERMAQGTDTVIIPTGGTEQNGPHIVIGKHNMIVRYTSGEIARQLNALAAPVLAYVPEGAVNLAEGHMKFPGTISVRDEGFAMVLEDAARSFKLHGFKRICFIGDHGGNQPAQALVAEKLTREWKNDGVVVIQVGDYYTDKQAEEWVKAQHIAAPNPQAHAGFMDASEVMAIDAAGVRSDQMQHFGEKDFPVNGAMGDPMLASAAYGKILLGLKVKEAVEQIRRESGRP